MGRFPSQPSCCIRRVPSQKSHRNSGLVILETRSVVDALRSEMQSPDPAEGPFLPGTALPELSVAQMFDVARPTAKAALDRWYTTDCSDEYATRPPTFLSSMRLMWPISIYLAAVIESAVARLLAERGGGTIGRGECHGPFSRRDRRQRQACGTRRKRHRFSPRPGCRNRERKTSPPSRVGHRGDAPLSGPRFSCTTSCILG